MRSKSVFVSHPSPLNPFPPCSAETEGSAPASALPKTGYDFLSVETLPGAEADGAAVPVLAADGGVAPPPHGEVITRTPTNPANELCSRLTSPSQISILLRDQHLQRRRHGPSRWQFVRRRRSFRQIPLRRGAPPEDGFGEAGRVRRPDITINPVHDRQACCYYLAHSFGRIYQIGRAHV